MNGIHHTYCHQMHWISSLRNCFYACDVSSEYKTWCFIFCQKSHRWALGGGEPTSVPFWTKKSQSETWFWWLFLSVLMKLAAAPDDASCITWCRMLRALLEATGCRLQASIGADSPRRLPWSSMLLCHTDGHKNNFYLARTIQNDGQTNWDFLRIKE